MIDIFILQNSDFLNLTDDGGIRFFEIKVDQKLTYVVDIINFDCYL